MKQIRLPYLRTLHRFELRRPYPRDDREITLILRPRGYQARLCTVTITADHADNASDIREFFDAVRYLANTPPPEPKRRRKARK